MANFFSLAHVAFLLNRIVYSFLITIILGIFSQSAYAQNENAIDYSDYLKSVQKQIKTNWHPPVSKLSGESEILFSIDKNGNVPSVKISHSAENTQMDRAALKAVVDSQPFALPPGNKDISVQYTFTYNPYHRGDKQIGNSPRIINTPSDRLPRHTGKKGLNDTFIWLFGLLYVLFIFLRNFANARRTNKEDENKADTFVTSQVPVEKTKPGEGILD